jgi:hypothetical protein
MGLGDDVVCLERVSTLVEIGVHEADADTILVEQSGSESNALKNDVKILDSLTTFLECHGTTIIDIDDNVVESQLDDIVGDSRGISVSPSNSKESYSFGTRHRWATWLINPGACCAICSMMGELGG